MKTLFWNSNSITKNLLPKKFISESAFEEYVFKNQDLLGDVVILYRQIHTGSKQGIPDMLGVDQDGNICIIEMKNIHVGEDILPQVLGYAIWADTNPDSIKAIWLESKNKPEDIQIDWDSISIRVIVIAPSFKPNVLRMTSKINYQVDLVQIQRFSYESDEFILVETMEQDDSKKPGLTTAMEEWTWEYYEKNHGKSNAHEFKKLVDALSSFVKEKGWNLPYNLNKYYTGFKFGNKVVFDVGWTTSSSSTWQLKLKIPEETAEAFTGSKWKFQRYDSPFKNALFRPKSGKFENIEELKALLELAYKRISGVDK